MNTPLRICYKETYDFILKKYLELDERLASLMINLSVKCFFCGVNYRYNNKEELQQYCSYLGISENYVNILFDCFNGVISHTAEHLPYFKSYMSECVIDESRVIMNKNCVVLNLTYNEYLKYSGDKIALM